MREYLETPDDQLKRPDAISQPVDLVNWGHRCVDCEIKCVVYEISAPAIGFEKRGPLCLKCLARRCGAARRIPFPMSEPLLDQLELMLGILPGPKTWFTFPKMPELIPGET